MRVTLPLNGLLPKPPTRHDGDLAHAHAHNVGRAAFVPRSRHGWCRAGPGSCRRSAAIRPGWRCARRPRRRTARAPRHRPGSCVRPRAGPRPSATIDARFSEAERAWSAADCETMLRLASVSLSARSRAVQRASARAASSADWRSFTLDCSSVVSKRASTWPGVTLSPRAPAPRRGPATRALTMVWSIGWVVPVKRTVSTRPRGLIVCSSAE